MFLSSRILWTIGTVAWTFLVPTTESFAPPAIPRRTFVVRASRYGPAEPNNNNSSSNNDDDERLLRADAQFRQLFEASMATTNPEHLPRLWGNHLELILSLEHGGSEMMTSLVEESKLKGEEHYEKAMSLMDLMLSFAEDFVKQAQQVDDANKKLLGKIIRAMTTKDVLGHQKEDLLDQLMQEEKQNFTPGFLRHMEGECNRIANAPKMTKESARLLEIVRVIQTRVLEEIGKDMGEATLVLGQLMGYDDQDELDGVLGAGLTVRGPEFAQEIVCLTEEALAGFKQVKGGVEPELVERVSFIDKRVRDYLVDKNEFQ